MTRQEFLDSVNDFGDLIDFCSDEGCDYCENIYYEDSFDDLVNDCVSGWARDMGWRDLRDRLDDIPSGYDWYDTSDEWRGLDDDDFRAYKDDVLEWGDDHDIWDVPDEDDEEIDDFEDDGIFEEDEDDDYEEPEDGCSFEELFAASSSTIQKVATDESDDDEAAAMIQMLMHS